MKQSKDLKTVAAKLPDSLIRRLDKAAKAAGRTRSSEVRIRLDESFRSGQAALRAVAAASCAAAGGGTSEATAG